MTEIEEVSDDERGWIRENLAALEAAGVDVHEPESLSRFYDRQYTEWASAPDDARPDPNPAINMVGIGLGECLNRLIGSTWVVANEESSCELAIHRVANNVTMYPPNAVGKRWSDGETGFIAGFVAAIVDRLKQLDAA